jgi:hypothetical protein
MTQTKMNIPKRGWQQELAKMAGCTVHTVINALHYDKPGKKADRVRRLYAAKYINQ